MEPLMEAKKAVDHMFRKPNVVAVLQQYVGAEDYWRNLPDTFFGNRPLYGNGSEYFRSTMRTLLKSATTTPPLPVEILNEIGLKPRDHEAFVRQKISEAIPSSYMPCPQSEIKVGSLVAVNLSHRRCEELGLHGFDNFEPVLARVSAVLDPETFECRWLVSLPARGEGRNWENGMCDGYKGKWSDWILTDGEPADPSVLRKNDIYAWNFKFMPGSNKLCGPAAAVLKTCREIFVQTALEQDAEDFERDFAVEAEFMDYEIQY